MSKIILLNDENAPSDKIIVLKNTTISSFLINLSKIAPNS